MTSRPPTMDPLQEMLDDHKMVSEWLINLDAAGRILIEAGTPAAPEALEQYFRVHVREHFLFEELRIFPALTAVAPGPGLATLIAELRNEHVDIYAETGRLFGELAWLAVVPGDDVARARAATRTRATVDLILAHARKEDERLLPLLEVHREPVLAWLKQA